MTSFTSFHHAAVLTIFSGLYLFMGRQFSTLQAHGFSIAENLRVQLCLKQATFQWAMTLGQQIAFVNTTLTPASPVYIMFRLNVLLLLRIHSLSAVFLVSFASQEKCFSLELLIFVIRYFTNIFHRCFNQPTNKQHVFVIILQR